VPVVRWRIFAGTCGDWVELCRDGLGLGRIFVPLHLSNLLLCLPAVGYSLNQALEAQIYK